MNENPHETRSRKRNRQVKFDLNRSTPQIAEKVTKPNTPKLPSKFKKKNLKMSQGEGVEPQIQDRSGTIINNAQQIPQGTLPTDRTGQGSSRQHNVGMENPGALQNSVMRIIEQGVGPQLSEIRRAMSDITTTVSRLSLIVQQTQQENIRLANMNLPSVSKTSVQGAAPMDMSGVNIYSNQSSRCSSVCNDVRTTTDNSKIRVDKWGLQFDGNTCHLAVEDFIFRLETLQKQYGIPWIEVLRDFHLLVVGDAKKWYWLMAQSNDVTSADKWPTLKMALMKQYQSTRSSFELMRDMVERKQMPGESIDAFFHTMNTLRSRLGMPMPEYEMIKMIKRNLRESVGKIVYPMSISSVEQLRIECIEAEKTFLRKDVRSFQPMPPNRFTKQVNEVVESPEEQYEYPEENYEELAAMRINNNNSQQRRNPLICWNCKEEGHVFMDCPITERTLFCYRCGKPDVISPKCPNCKGRYFQRGEVTAGDHRSTENPPMNLQ